MFSQLLQNWTMNHHNQPEFLDFRPYPQASDRNAWETLPRLSGSASLKPEKRFSITSIRSFWQQILWIFRRTGNRERYQERLFNRRLALNALVLAECTEHQGRFMDDIINGFFCICEETAWQLPAHNSYIRDTPQLILPDVNRPVVDLFAAETGAILSTAAYLLQEELDLVSPSILGMVYVELGNPYF